MGMGRSGRRSVWRNDTQGNWAPWEQEGGVELPQCSQGANMRASVSGGFLQMHRSADILGTKMCTTRGPEGTCVQ